MPVHCSLVIKLEGILSQWSFFAIPLERRSVAGPRGFHRAANRPRSSCARSSTRMPGHDRCRRDVDPFRGVAITGHLGPDELPALPFNNQLDPDLARRWIVGGAIQRFDASRNDRHALSRRIFRTQSSTGDGQIENLYDRRTDGALKLGSPGRQILAGYPALFGSDRSDVIQRPAAGGSRKMSRRNCPPQKSQARWFPCRRLRKSLRLRRLNSSVLSKFHVRCNTCVEQYHIGRIDSQSACCLDARQLVGAASDKC